MAKPNTSDIELPDISSDSSSGWEPQGNGTWKDSGGNIIYDENTIPADSPFENPPGGFPSTIEAPPYTPPLMPGPGPTPPPVPGPAPELPASLPPLSDTDDGFGDNEVGTPTQECSSWLCRAGHFAIGVLKGVAIGLAVAAAVAVIAAAAVEAAIAAGISIAVIVGASLVVGTGLATFGIVAMACEIISILQKGDYSNPETWESIGGLAGVLIPLGRLVALGEKYGWRIFGRGKAPKVPQESPPKVPGIEEVPPSNAKPVSNEIGNNKPREVVNRPKPATINKQKQAGHIKGTPQYNNRIKQGKPTSAFNDAESANQLTKIAWEKGKPVPGRPGVREFDFKQPIGTGPKGGTQSKVRVHQDANGSIHGHPSGPEVFP